MLLLASASVFGALCGLISGFFLKFLVDYEANRHFFLNVLGFVKNILSCDGFSEFLDNYLKLIKHLSKFIFKTLFITFLSLAPLGFGFVSIDKIYSFFSASNNGYFYVIGNDSVNKSRNEFLETKRQGTPAANPSLKLHEAKGFLESITSMSLSSKGLSNKVVICGLQSSCVVYKFLNFNVIKPKIFDDSLSTILVVKADSFDENIFWPYINSVELSFLFFSFLFSFLPLMFKKKRT